MSRLRPGLAIFTLALLASVGIHLPVYQVLGDLADALASVHSARPGPTTVEFELAPLSEQAEEQEPPVDSEPLARIKQPEQPPEPPEQQKPTEAEADKPRVAQLQLAVQPAAAPPPPPPPPDMNRLAVEQKSDDPDVPPPDNAQFTAEENRRVLDETVARVRNMHRDDAEPDPGRAPAEVQSMDEGAAAQTEVADLQEVKGDESRTADEVESQRPTHAPSQDSAGQRDNHAVTQQQQPQLAAEEQTAQRSAGSANTGGEEETILVEDAMGSFVIRRPVVGRGMVGKGGKEPPGSRSAHDHRRSGSRAQSGVDLALSWTQFENTFGSEKLEAERQAYIAQRKSTLRGSRRSKQWTKFRAAIENFVPNVKPGNQTALNAAASPFAAYLAAIHRRIHREYAFGFLRNIPIGGGPYDDMSLITKLEIIINGDGSLHKVGVVNTSGFMPFDYGAFSSVENAAPFPIPPQKIRSGDGRVYVHWAFYRNHRQCGTFNASPFILPNPGNTPKPGQGPLSDQPADAEFGAWPGDGDHDHEHATEQPHEHGPGGVHARR